MPRAVPPTPFWRGYPRRPGSTYAAYASAGLLLGSYPRQGLGPVPSPVNAWALDPQSAGRDPRALRGGAGFLGRQDDGDALPRRRVPRARVAGRLRDVAAG